MIRNPFKTNTPDIRDIKKHDADLTIALAGNPNVGKSTVFNALTGARQHTGNWAGKTVSNAVGSFKKGGRKYILTDLPGTYSLMSLSAEEESARNFICFGGADVTVIVCDAGCLSRNLNLALQILEITPKAVLCVNLIDEAGKKGIKTDLSALEKALGIPVTAAAARSGKGLADIVDAAEKAVNITHACTVRYHPVIENAVNILEMPLGNALDGAVNERFASLRLLEGDESFINSLNAYIGRDVTAEPAVRDALYKARSLLVENNIDGETFRNLIVSAVYEKADAICAAASVEPEKNYTKKQLKTDLFLTNRFTGGIVMMALLAVVFYITLMGANLISDKLAYVLSIVGDKLSLLLVAFGTPVKIHDALVFGMYKVLSWVTAVMLPPMAVFFPLFTILEDLGYLPRIAFNLDNAFNKCRSCGKQALTMCMGFGCNAAGVTGCRIIDSPRERLIAIITNSFVPCNGRFPMLIALITVFFAGFFRFSGIVSALMLTLFILLGVLMTFAASYLLSSTLLSGVPSALTLELPPFRMPQFGKVIVRSVFDRTLFVLGRAIVVAAPAGLVIWLLANIHVGEASILAHITNFLDPIGRIMGLDGVILAAFILGLPANEIVLPIMIMAYTASGTLAEYESLSSLHSLLVSNGWTWLTALNVCIFTLMHWPCSTTIMTIKKETGSLKWTAVSVILPALCGAAICIATTALYRLII